MASRPLTRSRAPGWLSAADDEPIIFDLGEGEYVCPECGTKVVPTDELCPSLAACHECGPGRGGAVVR